MTIRILTVCTGNVCRSPLAAQMLASRLDPKVFEITSAGTTALSGDQMPEPAQQISTRMGLAGAAEHRASSLTAEALANADLILGMEREHRSYAAEIEPTVVRRAFTLLEFAHITTQINDAQLFDLIHGKPEVEIAAVEAVMRMRGAVTRLRPPRLYDVEDPYGRSKQVYERSARQTVQAVEKLVKFFDRARVVTQQTDPAASTPLRSTTTGKDIL